VIDVVEIDPETTEVAKKYFKLEDDPRMNIIHNDARIFLNEETKAGKNKYDTIYNDAFSSACAVPAHLTTEEAVEEVYELLDEDGVYIVNTISALEGEKSTFFRAEYKTISEVFDGIYVFRTKESGYGADDVQNIMIVATKNKEGIEQIGKRFRENGGDEKTGKLLENYWGKEIKTDDVQILTDDFSPVSYYAAAACSVD
jgi:spermidine synthase